MKKNLVFICATICAVVCMYGQSSSASFIEEDVAYEDKNVKTSSTSFLQATNDVVIQKQNPSTTADIQTKEHTDVYKNTMSAPITGGKTASDNRHHNGENMPGGGNVSGHRPPHSGGFTQDGRPPAEELQNTLIIKSNVNGAQVYLDGKYYGLTPLTLQNIMPGTYDIQLFMDGYEMFPQRIRVFNGHETSYFVQMEKRTGFLQVMGIDGEFFVYSDGKLLREVINRLDEGYHTIKIRKFGYKDFYAKIFIQAHTLKKITVSLEKAKFEITSFSASKKSFNPTYEGAVGSCVFEAEVTAPGSGTLSISDSNGTVVFERTFARFSSWSQRISWQGTDENGDFVPQGMYTAVFSARGEDSASNEKEYTARARTSIDYTLVYHLSDITESGLGFGSTPAALIMPKGAVNVQIHISPHFNLNNKKSQFPIGIGFYVAPLECMDLSGTFSYNIEQGNYSLIASADMRFLFSKALAKNHLNYGFSIEYGWSNNDAFLPYGIATGAGINPALMIGLDTDKVFFGFTTQCAFGCLSSNPLGNDNVWKNSLELSFKPNPRLSVDMVASLHSSFGDFELYGGDGFECNWTRAIELFAGSSVMLSGVPLICKLGLKSFIFPSNGASFGFSAGMNYLFLK
ncbi:MAG: PEGA domain-containing protein [Treponema sp.]|nr:PEGA domain-containing protein [Treponema sp.]